MVNSVLASGEVDHGFELRYSQTRDYEIGVWCFSTKHASLSSKNYDWLAYNQDNVSKWSDKSTSELLF